MFVPLDGGANGGAAANTACELSWLGRKVAMVGGIGNDDLGNIALKGLIAAGVNVDHVLRRSDWKTGCAAIRSMGKSKSILTAGVVDVAVIFDSLKTLSVQQSDHVHFSLDPISRDARSITALPTHGYFFVMGNGRSNEHTYRRIV
jgi:sugar/nucleoside kinase (ribokinase family)